MYSAFVDAEHVVAGYLMGFEFELVERRVEYAQRVHIGVREAFDRPGKIVRVPAFVNERPLTSTLAAGVDSFLGDSDVDLAEGLAKTQVLFLDPLIRSFRIDQSRNA